MNDEIKIKNLSQAIQYSEEFVYHQSTYKGTLPRIKSRF